MLKYRNSLSNATLLFSKGMFQRIQAVARTIPSEEVDDGILVVGAKPAERVGGLRHRPRPQLQLRQLGRQLVRQLKDMEANANINPYTINVLNRQ